MKIAVRKSVLALGTALTVAITPVTAPVLSPLALAQEATTPSTTASASATTTTAAASATTTTTPAAEPKGDAPAPQFSANRALKEGLYNSWLASKADYDNKLKAVNALDGTVTADTAITAISEARTSLLRAKAKIDAAGYLVEVAGSGFTNAAEEATNLRQVSGYIDDANASLSTVASKIDIARRGDNFVCPNAINSDEFKQGANNGDSGSVSGSSLSTFTNLFNSNANRIVYEGGKRQCISNAEYVTKRLTAIGAVLGVIFTVISNVTKIQGIIDNLVPGAKPAAN